MPYFKKKLKADIQYGYQVCRVVLPREKLSKKLWQILKKRLNCILKINLVSKIITAKLKNSFQFRLLSVIPKLPQISGKVLIKALQKIGFKINSQRGSHIKLQRIISGKMQTVIIPNHKVIKKGTLRNGILKPIGLSVKELIDLL